MEKGEKCPLFSLQNQDNKTINIADFIGKQNLVIYFYPKDNTKVCTAEACEFRDRMNDFAKLDSVVFGISSDSVSSHKKFADENKITFDILADTDKSVRKLFGIKANLFGLVPGRETFVIDKNGIIQGVFNSLTKSKAHIDFAREILKDLL
jgi:peroxiredoxin Q/BCP